MFADYPHVGPHLLGNFQVIERGAGIGGLAHLFHFPRVNRCLCCFDGVDSYFISYKLLYAYTGLKFITATLQTGSLYFFANLMFAHILATAGLRALENIDLVKFCRCAVPNSGAFSPKLTWYDSSRDWQGNPYCV